MKTRIKVESGGAVVELDGKLDESAAEALNELKGKLPQGTVQFSFARVNYLNSIGMATWASFANQIGSGRELLLTACPPFVIDAINMMTSFAGGARVTSFYAPYSCGKCESTKRILIEARALKASDALPSANCPDCGMKGLEPEVDPESFLRFLKS